MQSNAIRKETSLYLDENFAELESIESEDFGDYEVSVITPVLTVIIISTTV